MDTHLQAGPSQRAQVAALSAIFFVSGFCGLIYESIWSHYLKLLLGHAAYAQAVVLVVFVGGLALGAWLTGLIAHRIRQPILWYAVVEAAVAAMAFGFQGVFQAASAWATGSLFPAACADGGLCSPAWLLAAALILPPSILLGATFPLMTTGVIRLGAQPGRGLSVLYFLNSAGAALGVLGSGFVLIPKLGLPGTILLAGICNALVGLAAFLVIRLGQRPGSEVPALPAQPQPTAPRSELRLLLAVAALTGLSSFIYEVVWIRMLTLVLGAATHSFELMLAPFILGLAIGAWWIRNRIDNRRDALRLLARIQVLMGVLAVATLPLYASLFDAMAWALHALARTEASYVLFNVASGTMAAAVMLPATICAGMTLPLITAILLRNGFGERQVGQVYGVNTFGAILGVIAAVHVLMPLLGLKWALAVGAAVDVALGLGLWLAARRLAPPPGSGAVVRPAWRTGLAPVGLAAAASASLVIAFTAGTPLEAKRLASGVFRYGEIIELQAGQAILFHEDGKTATVTVRQQANGARSLITNGKVDGATDPQGKAVTPDDHTMVLLGALGPAHHPAARTAAVIGMGTGTTSAVLLGVRTLERVDTIEIEPKMVDAAHLFRPRVDPVFTDPRSRVVIDDARAYFAKTGARYDLIVSEPSNPWVSGVSGLFSVEFYRHVAAHLAADGHFVQWLHTYEASPQMVASILRAFSSVFPEFRAYATAANDIVLVARADRRLPQLQPAALAAMPSLQRHLSTLGIDDAGTLAAHEVGRADTVMVLANAYGVPPNTDYFPYVDQQAGEDRFRRSTAVDLFALGMAPVPLLEFATGAPAHAGHVTRAPGFQPPHMRRAAAGVQDLRFLRGETLEPGELALIGAEVLELALVRSWFRDCHLPSGTGPLWSAVVTVASELNGGLAPRDAAGYWRGLAQACGKAMSPAQRAWIDLFAATGARDGAAAAAHARQALALDQDLTQQARAYATLAGVAGEISAGRRKEAAELLNAQRRHLPATVVELPWFRYLVFSLTARPTAPPA